ncbi:MAG: hypothetical protein KAH32_08270, partial [Chlamydiia bacterium]|nr:hypothetical protein [Chlamydiia bacterium]
MRYLTIFFLLFNIISFSNTANSQSFKVLLVDDDANGIDESSTIDSALAHSGYTYSTLNLGSNPPTYNDLKDYDMIIWTTANDGLDLNLWNSSSIEFSAGLSQYLDSNGVVWIDGMDFIYDKYGSAPDVFSRGDFVFDKLGISKYVGQSFQDDGSVGLSIVYRTNTNSINYIDSIKWKWSSLQKADAFEITPFASSLYVMGPSSYVFAGKSIALYKDNIITSTLRIGSIGDASVIVQDDIDSLVISMIRAVKNGLPPSDIIAPVAISATAHGLETIQIAFSEALDSTSASNTANYTGIPAISSISLCATKDSVTLTLSPQMISDQTYNLVIDNVKDASLNPMDSAQTFVITAPHITAFKVILVNDDDNHIGYTDDSSHIRIALDNSGYNYKVINAVSSAPSYSDLKNYDLVIWSMSNDRDNLKLWKSSSVEFSDGLSQYLDSNGT